MTVEIVCDDVLHWAETTEHLGAHALLADAPYELNFMGSSTNGWDNTGIAFAPSTWAALARHLLPGAFLMVFASTRGYHRLACALEDAGLIIHPCIVWIQAQGWPKSTKIDTAIDKAAGVERETEQYDRYHDGRQRVEQQSASIFDGRNGNTRELPALPLAQAWAGHRYGRQMLRPSCELIAIAQKPYEGAAVESIVKYGAGALNIDAGRVMTGDDTTTRHSSSSYMTGTIGQVQPKQEPYITGGNNGRWPPNLALVHTQQCRPLGLRVVRGDARQGLGTGGMMRQAENTHHPVSHGYAAPDGMEQIMQWACAEGCPVAILDDTTMVAHNVLPLYTEEQEVQLCCATASTADVNLLLGRMMSSAGLDGSVAVPVGACPYVNPEAKPLPGDSSTNGQADGPDVGVSQEAGSSTSKLSIDGSGSNTTAPFQTAMRSIMPTMIQATTQCPTCSASLLLSIEITTEDSVNITVLSQTEQRHENASAAMSTNRLRNMLVVQQGLIKATVKIANAKPSVSGKPPTQGTKPNISGDGVNAGRYSRFFPQHGWADEIAERLQGVMPAYYCGKASASERAAGLPGRNIHNTIKPLSLCRWLASLLLPPALYAPRRLLIPFAGVFSEVVGALHAGFEEITAVEREAAYVKVGRKRLAYWTGQRGMASAAAPPPATEVVSVTGEQLSLY